MEHFETLSQATNSLLKRGYTYSFEAKPKCLKCNDGSEHTPDHFNVLEVHRFEGMSNPADSSVVYAIETSDGKKGLLIDSYGAYAENLSPEMVQKMRMIRP